MSSPLPPRAAAMGSGYRSDRRRDWSRASSIRRVTACHPLPAATAAGDGSASLFRAISAGLVSSIQSICAACARVTVSSVGVSPSRALRSSHALTFAKRLRLPSIFSDFKAAGNCSPESQVKK